MTTPIKPDEIGRIASLLTSDLVVADYLGDIEIDGFAGLTKLSASSLKADAPADAKAQRFELITAAKAGKHIELQAVAQTFAQTRKPNRRYLRLADDHLETAAPTWKGQPYLKDHTTWAMSSQMGTLLSSRAEPIAGGMAFQQKLHATATEAVIGILDGRWGKFSIGWFYEGPILCSLHDCDITKSDSCGCWPGDKVMLDGKERIAEFVFTKYSGKETSSVVIPAVQDTHVGDVKAALAAELGISDRLTRRTVAVPNKVKESKMNLFHRLAVQLGLTALSEENEHGNAQILAAVEALRQRAVTAETKLATTEGKLSLAETAVSTLTAASVGIQIDAVLQAEGYRAGKLAYGRDSEGKRIASPLESFLRGLGTNPKGGIDVMKAQLSAMPVIVPVGQRPQSEGVAAPGLTVIGQTDETELNEQNPYLQNAAAQTGVKVSDMVAFAKGHVQEGI